MRYRIPAELIKAWEDGGAAPDAVALAYLQVIARDPEMVRVALQPPRRKSAA